MLRSLNKRSSQRAGINSRIFHSLFVFDLLCLNLYTNKPTNHPEHAVCINETSFSSWLLAVAQKLSTCPATTQSDLPCSVPPGWPAPAVTWYRDDSPVTGSWFRAVDGSSRSELALGPLTRADLGSRVTCQTTYHASSPPKTATAAIDMIRKCVGRGVGEGQGSSFLLRWS